VKVVASFLADNETLSSAVNRRLAAVELCCDEKRGQKRRREDEKEEGKKAPAAAAAAQAPPVELAAEGRVKMIALPKTGGGLVNVTKKKWGRVRGGTSAEKEGKKIADYTEWVKQVLIPAGVDMKQVTADKYAKLIGRRDNIITAYREAQGWKKQK